MHPILASSLLLVATASAFAPSSTTTNNLGLQQQQSPTSLQAATKAAARAPTIPNPFKSLPWNVEKAQKSKEHKLKLERSKLHRLLGIAEDATYEELNEATEKMIERADGDMKRKILIEVTKDKILQIRLNERLAGFMSDIVTKEAKDQSRFDTDGNTLEDELNDAKEAKNKDWEAPAWTKGLIVKPDAKYITKQVRLWGVLTAIGLALPPFIAFGNRFSWLICIAQLSFRGMPQNQQGSGGMAMDFGGSGGKSHIKVAWLLGLTVTFFGFVLTYGLMPSWAKNQRFTPFCVSAVRNAIYGTACCYLQPYKKNAQPKNED